MGDGASERKKKLDHFKARTRDARFQGVEPKLARSLRDEFLSQFVSETGVADREAAVIADSVRYEVAHLVALVSSPVGGELTAQWDGSPSDLRGIVRDYAVHAADSYKQVQSKHLPT